MKIFAHKGKASLLMPLILTVLLGGFLIPLFLSSQEALAAPARQSLPSSSSCVVVRYVVTNQWPGGFSATITITNECPTPITINSLAFDFTAGQQLLGGWNAIFTQSGSHVTATTNVTIPPGGSITIGIIGTCGASNPPPIAFTLNGAPV